MGAEANSRQTLPKDSSPTTLRDTIRQLYRKMLVGAAAGDAAPAVSHLGLADGSISQTERGRMC